MGCHGCDVLTLYSCACFGGGGGGSWGEFGGQEWFLLSIFVSLLNVVMGVSLDHQNNLLSSLVAWRTAELRSLVRWMDRCRNMWSIFMILLLLQTCRFSFRRWNALPMQADFWFDLTKVKLPDSNWIKLKLLHSRKTFTAQLQINEFKKKTYTPPPNPDVSTVSVTASLQLKGRKFLWCDRVKVFFFLTLAFINLLLCSGIFLKTSCIRRVWSLKEKKCLQHVSRRPNKQT